MTRKSNYLPAIVTPAKFISRLKKLLSQKNGPAATDLRSEYLRVIDVLFQLHANTDTTNVVIAQLIARLTGKKIDNLEKLQRALFELTKEISLQECTKEIADVIIQGLSALQDIFDQAYKQNQPYQDVLLLGLWYKTIEEIASSKMKTAEVIQITAHAVDGLLTDLRTTEKKEALRIFANFFPHLVTHTNS